MRALVAAGHSRLTAVLGRLSMYRLTLLGLGLLAAYAFALSFTGDLVAGPLALLAALAVLVVACVGVDLLLRRLRGIPVRLESSLITAHILLFVLRPTTDPLGLVGIALAGMIAVASKHLLTWRGRHVLNPAAAGAAALTVVSVWLPALGASAWWVGTPLLAAPVILVGLAVLLRTEKVRVAALFLVVAIAVGLVRTLVQYQAAGIAVDPGLVLLSIAVSSPYLFLGAFMLSEPLTLPPRHRQQLLVAVVVGVLAGWPIDLGLMSLGQERALLVGNLVAFALAARPGLRLVLVDRRRVTPTVCEVTFRAEGPMRFLPGQYLELDVPHPRPDARGTRREFSIVSAPAELPLVRLAYRENGAAVSTYKRALGGLEPGGAVSATGVWGDFTLPGREPVLMVAAGIGVTPFVSQLADAAGRGSGADAVLVYVAAQASELAFRSEIAGSGVPVIVFTPDEPDRLPAHWRWIGERIDAAALARAVPDLAARRALVSGPPRLIADLAPALQRARSIRTDAFAGY